MGTWQGLTPREREEHLDDYGRWFAAVGLGALVTASRFSNYLEKEALGAPVPIDGKLKLKEKFTAGTAWKVVDGGRFLERDPPLEARPRSRSRSPRGRSRGRGRTAAR